MSLLKNIAIKGLLPGAGTIASSVGAWQAYEGSAIANPFPFVSPSELLTIEDNGGTRSEKLAVGGCFKKYFPGVNISWTKDDSAKEPTASVENGPFGNGPGDVQGCLLVDMKYRDTDNKKAISLESELALVKGNHGLAIWNKVNNLTQEAFTETIYAVRLSWDGRKWKVDRGYSWISKGMGYATAYHKLELYFDNKLFAKLDDVNTSNCSKNTTKCELFNKSAPTKNLKYTGYFRTDLGGDQRVFTKLKIKDELHGPDFWGREDIFAEDNTRERGFRVFEHTYKNNTWKKGTSDQTYIQLPATLKAWFKPFTESRGKWIDMHRQLPI